MIQTVQLAPDLAPRLRLGHPWVYRNHLPRGLQLRSGDWLQLRCGTFTAYGLYDAESPIAVRIFSRSQLPDAAWTVQRLREAWELREALRESGTSAYRLVYGEGDGLPGLVVDLYGPFAVIRIYAEALRVLITWVQAGLRELLPLRGILLRRRADEIDEEGKVELLWGQWPPDDLTIEEHGLIMRANLRSGQKTGLFLDQRENRRTVEQYSRDRTVLNCFAYTGGFSLAALRGGARLAESVDIAAAALADAEANVLLNGFDPQRHRAVARDCFELLADYAQAGKRFDLVIVDPPSFARARQQLHAAIRAYARLNAQALRCVDPGGLLVSSSCTSQVSPEAFREMLAQAASMAGRRLQIIHDTGQPLDHPVPAQFPEGRYLKFMIGRVLEAD